MLKVYLTIVGLLIIGFFAYQTFNAAEFLVVGEWRDGKVTGGGTEILCDDTGNCGIPSTYSDVEYVDNADTVRTLRVQGEFDGTFRLLVHPTTGDAVAIRGDLIFQVVQYSFYMLCGAFLIWFTRRRSTGKGVPILEP